MWSRNTRVNPYSSMIVFFLLFFLGGGFLVRGAYGLMSHPKEQSNYMYVKYLAQGHKLHTQDSNPYPVWWPICCDLFVFLVYTAVIIQTNLTFEFFEKNLNNFFWYWEVQYWELQFRFLCNVKFIINGLYKKNIKTLGVKKKMNCGLKFTICQLIQWKV